MASLCKIRDDGSAAERWAIGDALIAGRGDRAKAQVWDDTVSRQHFLIARADDGHVIEDLNSRNGTWVDGRRVLVARLHPGACIVAGKTVFIFQTGREAGARENWDSPPEETSDPQRARDLEPAGISDWPESWYAHSEAA